MKECGCKVCVDLGVRGEREEHLEQSDLLFDRETELAEASDGRFREATGRSERGTQDTGVS